MAKEADYKELLTIIARHPDGVSLDQIHREASLDLSLRTTIRRLADLVASGQIRKSGRSRATRYLPAVALPQDQSEPFSQTNLFAPLSKAGEDLLREVSKPLSARRAVGYARAFLESYAPNQSAYLSSTERKHLHAISRMAEAPNQPADTYAQHILNRLLIDLSWNSSRLEGNTYTLLDTKRLIEVGEPAAGKDPVDAQMILNHKAAIEFLVQSAKEIGFNRYTILNLHALLAENLLPDQSAAGRIRRFPVSISKSLYHPLETPQMLEECFNLVLTKADAIEDPFEQAFFVLVQLPYLQPFEDVNKRVSRLAANIPLIRKNLSPLSFVDVVDETYVAGLIGVYERNDVTLLKDVFLWAYERSAERYAAIQQTIGQPDQLRLRYRTELKDLVAAVIRGPMDPGSAAAYIAKWTANHIPGEDRSKFIETVETELLSLHEGNFARFRIRPSEFEAWRRLWKS